MGLKNSIKKRGVSGTIKFIFNNSIMLGKKVKKQQEEIDTLYYFLNSYVDISDLPPTNDEDLRIMQLGLLEFLKIFDKVCQEHNLRYFLSCGTLLGAYRHKGFIPWDDDLDVSMPREDYDKVIPLLQKEMAQYGIIVRHGGDYDDMGPMQRLAFSYKTKETGMWLDIFPIDTFNAKGTVDEVRNSLSKARKEYLSYYNKFEHSISQEKMLEKKNEIFGKYENLTNGNNKVMIDALEFTEAERFIDEEVVFPLKKIQFEDAEFYVPNNCEEYLNVVFGKNYMLFPKSDVEHHCDPDGFPAKTRAKRHNIDMNDVISYLKSVYDKI